MRKWIGRVMVHLLWLSLLAWAAPGVAQQASQSQGSGSSQQPPEDSKEKKDKKKNKKDKGASDVDTTVFSEGVVNTVLSDLRDGLEGHSQRLMLSAFDSDKMDGYLSFEDQIEAFFNRYNSFRVHFRIAQTSTEGAKGIALVDIELEEIPRGGASPPVRKQSQMRFELERGKKGWKIVDFRPRGFFS